MLKSASGARWASVLDRDARAMARRKAAEHGLSFALASLLLGRSVPDDRWRASLDPDRRALAADPFAPRDMAIAAARLAEAIERKEKIGVIGDYDVDGATSSAILSTFLTAAGTPHSVHIPNRVTEGYGPSVAAMNAFADRGVRLVVTLDCGSSANVAIDHGRSRGIETIVLDHHKVPDAPPQTLALVNPNRPDDSSGLGALCAAGVAWLAIRATMDALPRARRPDFDPDSLLDLVALGTIADVAPLTDLNRALVRDGLDLAGERRRLGFNALLEVAQIEGAPSVYDLGYKLGPRINAAGRIGDQRLGYEMLTSLDPAFAAGVAKRLDALNLERREIEAACVSQAGERVKESFSSDQRAIVVYDASYLHGLVGLVAGRLRERFERPAIVFCQASETTATGSARSTPDIDIGALVQRAVAAGIAFKGGGHAMAAGLSLDIDRIGDLKAFLEAEIARSAPAPATPVRTIDVALDAADFTYDLYRDLERFGPYGSHHAEPVVAVVNHKLENLRPMGQGHMRCDLVSPRTRKRVRAVAFSVEGTQMQEIARQAAQGAPVHAVGTVSWSKFVTEGLSELKISDLAIET